MTEPNTIYTITRPLPASTDKVYLTPAEQRIIEWIRRGTNSGGDWMGTIRYVSGPGIYQMSDHVKAGQAKTP